MNATAPMTSPSARKRERPQLQHLARRPVELELARGDAPGDGLLQQFGERILGEHFAVARAVELARGRVAHDFAPDPVDDDDRVDRLVERADEPVLHRFGLRNPVIGLLLHLFDRAPQRRVRRDAERGADRLQLAPLLHEASDNHTEREPPDNGDDEQEHVQRRRPRVRITRTGR